MYLNTNSLVHFMAKIQEKEKAIKLRLKGLSYSQIKIMMGLSKSTLSNWLSKYPLSPEKINELRGSSPQRIEKCRNTKARKVQERLDAVYKKVSNDIGELTERELFIAGVYLYWGEGSKSEKTTTGLSNTDPGMLRFFLKWLRFQHVDIKKLCITLQLYVDMDIKKEIKYWSEQLGLPVAIFRKPYVKKSTLAGLTYKRGFGHGTCNIRLYNRDLAEYVHMAMKRIATMNL